MKKEKIVTWIMVVLLTFYQIGIQTCAKENVALNNVCDENLISTEVREYFDENYQGLLKCFAQEHYNTNDLYFSRIRHGSGIRHVFHWMH